MGKKYLETKKESLESSILGLWQEAAKKEEELSPKQKKIDVDGDGEIEGSDLAKLRKKGAKKEGNAFGKALMAAKDKGDKTFVVGGKTYEVKEEADLEEGKMSQLHQMIKDKKSAEEIAKAMKVDVKTIKSLMSSYESTDGDTMGENGKYMEMLAAACGGGPVNIGLEYNPMDESAASDARRAMSRDKDFSRKDSADDDDDATDDDVKGASKNIIMQMRKAQSLNGRFPVEFADKKKVKIPAKMAIAVQQKYNAMKKPADKEKFQTRIGKSYKDMLSALKEELQPKKESILERMNRKIKENKDG